MTRRKSLIAVPAAAAAMPAAGRPPSILELRYFQLRNGGDMQSQRAGDFVRQMFMPALARAGGRVNGVFANLVAPNGPFLLVLSSFASMPVFDTAMDRLNNDKQYLKDLETLDAKGGLSFVRMETNLLRAFTSMPDVEGSGTEGKPARVFELRTYESNSPVTLRRKIKMFEEGETAIFRRVGLTPVFFGETIAGQRMPNLTYMLVYESLSAREKNWAAFGADAAWLKLRATPGLSDAEIVSNISNTLLRPLPFSPIR